jgi:phosphoribosylformylglycinamidine synthase subunit PurSL
VLHVLPRAGVTDPAAETALEACGLLGLRPSAVRSVRKYWLPTLSAADADRLAWKLLASEAIHDVVIGPLPHRTLAGGRPWTFSQETVRLAGLDDASLDKLSRERCLALSAAELHAVRDHFQSLGRDPLEIELETIAQTWSEHCCHKTLGSPIDHVGPAGAVRYDNLLKETVFASTRKVREQLGTNDWCVSVFRDNSGVVRFDGDHDICVKVETHNHPSAIEPYGGAATGLGGVIRDVLGTGLGAKPIANLDVFCVGRPDTAAADLPPGVIHPRRLLAGVVAGVRDYGNRMGIPTIAGAVAFDPGYIGNPLVFCGTVGIMPRNSADAAVQVGDLVVVAGGRTGRDGIHGATFSSVELSSDSESQSGGSVQIGHAIHEKMLSDFVLEASRQRLFHAITDCGAGGLSSAVGEMAATLGAEVDLDRVPLKYDGLSATEAWISEAQERMVLAVAPADWEKLSKIAADEGVEATAIGRPENSTATSFTRDDRDGGSYPAMCPRPWSRLRGLPVPTTRSPHVCSTCSRRPTWRARNGSSASTTTRCRAAASSSRCSGRATVPPMAPSSAASSAVTAASCSASASATGSALSILIRWQPAASSKRWPMRSPWAPIPHGSPCSTTSAGATVAARSRSARSWRHAVPATTWRSLSPPRS